MLQDMTDDNAELYRAWHDAEDAYRDEVVGYVLMRFEEGEWLGGATLLDTETMERMRALGEVRDDAREAFAATVV